VADHRTDPFGALTHVDLAEGRTSYFRIGKLAEDGLVDLDRMPFSIRILLENALRSAGRGYVTEDDVKAVARGVRRTRGRTSPSCRPAWCSRTSPGCPRWWTWPPCAPACMSGRRGRRINPVVPADMVIDHSVQVDFFGSQDAYRLNVEKEMERNRERYQLLRWGQHAFRNFRVVPPGTGIVHQVNLEYLASVVHRREEDGLHLAYPDTLVGTDSHTTMINGLGVVGWGVGGIEAEAVLLGQPYYMLLPEVVGVKITGSLPEGATATDLVLRVTELLRNHGVVGRFVEFFGTGLSALGLADRATIANMSPEYGATSASFPWMRRRFGTSRAPAGAPSSWSAWSDLEGDAPLPHRRDTRIPSTPPSSRSTWDRGALAGRAPASAGPGGARYPCHVVPGSCRGSCRRGSPSPTTTAGRTRPNPGVHRLVGRGWPAVHEVTKNGGDSPVGASATGARGTRRLGGGPRPARPRTRVEVDGQPVDLTDGSIVIAAITSCTNTSNPSVMVGAGLLAKKAVERGLDDEALDQDLHGPGLEGRDRLPRGGKAAPLPENSASMWWDTAAPPASGTRAPWPSPSPKPSRRQGLVVASVLSGNRNFEARIHPLVRANYLASPMLVVAFALAGRIDVDLHAEPIGTGSDGEPVYLKDVWPSQEEIRDTIRDSLKPSMYGRATPRFSRATSSGRPSPFPREMPPSTNGTTTPPTSGTLRSSRA
jgi:aconitate hydratase